MALPPAAPGSGEPGRTSAAAGARLRQDLQRSAVAASFVRRRAGSSGAFEVGDEPIEQLVANRHVLQSDFANVVVSETGGYNQCEVVFDGDEISIFSAAGGGGGGSGLTSPQVLARGLGC